MLGSPLFILLWSNLFVKQGAALRAVLRNQFVQSLFADLVIRRKAGDAFEFRCAPVDELST